MSGLRPVFISFAAIQYIPLTHEALSPTSVDRPLCPILNDVVIAGQTNLSGMLPVNDSLHHA
jgi:hypothetical protein